jgi:hypothetical protein
MKETGAGYVIFTIMQQQRFMIAPNETFNRLTGYKTGEACSSRDLIEELYQTLHKRDVCAEAQPNASTGYGITFTDTPKT